MNYLGDIQDIIESVDFGNVVVTTKRHSGNTHQIIIHSYENIKFDKNADLVAHILQILKNAVERQYSGSLSFTVVCKNGKTTRLITQDNEQVDYFNKKYDNKNKTTGEGLHGNQN